MLVHNKNKARAMCDHLRQRYSEDAVVSLPDSLCSGLLPLLDPLRLHGRIEPDVEQDEQREGGTMFMKFVLLHPSSFRSVPMNALSNRNLGDRCFMVTLHRRVQHADGTSSLVQSPNGAPMVLDLDCFASDLERLESDMLKWSVHGQSSSMLLGLNPAEADHDLVAAVSRELVLHQAWPNAKKYWRQPRDSRFQIVLRALEGAGFLSAQPSGQPGCDDWAMTPAGAKRLKQVSTLESSAQVFDVDCDLPIEDFTTWELMSTLDASCWEWRPMPDTKHRAGLGFSLGGKL